MSSNVNFDGHGTGRTRSGPPDTAAWWDACAAVCRQAGQRISGWSQAGARYVRERRMQDMTADLTALARRRPGQTLAIAAALGALVGAVIYGLSRPR